MEHRRRRNPDMKLRTMFDPDGPVIYCRLSGRPTIEDNGIVRDGKHGYQDTLGELLCIREKCGFWIAGTDKTTDTQRCAVAVLAVRLGALDNIADAISGLASNHKEDDAFRRGMEAGRRSMGGK